MAIVTRGDSYHYAISKVKERNIMVIVVLAAGDDNPIDDGRLDYADVTLSLEGGILRRPRVSFNGNVDYTSLLCLTLQQKQSSKHDNWVDWGVVSVHLQRVIQEKHPGVDCKEKVKAIRMEAESRNLIEVGRRVLNQNNNERIIVTTNKKKTANEESNDKLMYSNEMYIRLLSRSVGFSCNVDDTESSEVFTDVNAIFGKPKGGKSNNAFIPRLPPNTNLRDFVHWLERNYDVKVRRAMLELNATKPKYYAARVEFATIEECSTILAAANRSAGGKGVTYLGQSIGIIPDARTGVLDVVDDEDYFPRRRRSDVKPATPRSAKAKLSKKIVKLEGLATPEDVSMFCNCLAQVEGTLPPEGQGWVSGGHLGAVFRLKLPQSFLDNNSKEEVSAKFKQVRDTAIRDGLVEMGRRKQDNPNEYINVEKADSSGDTSLFPETYLRLLSPGRSRATDTSSSEQRTSEPSPLMIPSL